MRVRCVLKCATVVAYILALRGTGSAQVYFPLHIGDNWTYEDRTSLFCEGVSVIFTIKSDTLINGRTYMRPSLFSPHSGAVRADSARVFEYDTTTRREYVMFDFFAKPGDTLSIRDNGTRIMVALGSLTFGDGSFSYTVRDSIGVARIYDSRRMCDFRLTGAWINGKEVALAISSVDRRLPNSPTLEQNYPNPFNPTTTIHYSLPWRSHVSLAVFDVLGQHIAALVDEVEEPGLHTAVFNGASLSTGVYVYRLQAGRYVLTRTMVMVK